MIMSHWPFWFRQLYGVSWPRNYITWDCETTGFDKKRDVIAEIGHCLIEDGKVKDRLGVVLDWTEHAIVPDQWLRARLEQTRQSMARDGKVYHLTYERMKEEGVRPPEKVLSFYYKLFRVLLEQNTPFAAHNGFFDEEMFAHNLVGFSIAPSFQLPDNLIFDTMSIEKANQMLTDKNARPREGETLRTYFKRVKHIRNDVKTNLDTHCVAKYDLIARYALDVSKAHTADFDAYLVHLLMEEFRLEADKQTVAPSPVEKRSDLPPLFRSQRGGVVRKPPEGVTAGGSTLPRYRKQRNR